jgi:tetratricopeptide (TPR) repeat protein
MEWLSACCVVRPNDAEARLVQARVWAQLGRRAEALDSLDRAAAIDDEPAELQALRRKLEPRPPGRKK